MIKAFKDIGGWNTGTAGREDLHGVELGFRGLADDGHKVHRPTQIGRLPKVDGMRRCSAKVQRARRSNHASYVGPMPVVERAGSGNAIA